MKNQIKNGYTIIEMLVAFAGIICFIVFCAVVYVVIHFLLKVW